MASWNVREWMSSTFITISPKTTLERARAHLQSGHVPELLVMDEGKLVGALGERDLWRRCPKGALLLDERRADELLAVIQVGGVMILSPPTVTPETSVFEAAQLFLQSGRQSLPVVEEGVLQGLLTQQHLLAAMAALEGEITKPKS
ncbi:MAG: CBS domain-containing protein [Deltaproteobacteria bacterium]|nr:CBS domain-containing protein [Deltaproteobacteria bacterium]